MAASWRDTASEQCQSDFDALLDQCIDIAAENLVRNWGLNPVAVVVAGDGERSLVMAETSDQRSSRDELVGSLQRTADSTRSFALVSRVSDESSEHLIEVHLEHRDIAIQMVFPYDIPDTSTFNLGTPHSALADHRLFTRGDN